MKDLRIDPARLLGFRLAANAASAKVGVKPPPLLGGGEANI